MKKSPQPSNKENETTLEFPMAPDFVSLPPKVDPQAMLERIAQKRLLRKETPEEAARRAAEKIPVEFVL